MVLQSGSLSLFAKQTMWLLLHGVQLLLHPPMSQFMYDDEDELSDKDVKFVEEDGYFDADDLDDDEDEEIFDVEDW